MTFPTANVRIEAGPFRLFTISRHPHTLLKSRCKGTGHLPAQAHKFAGVGPVNGRYRAGTAQAAPPGWTKQAAFFTVATAIVVAIKIFTFGTGWSFHMFNVPQVCGTFYRYTRVR
jgi:hypothetical protein